MTTAACAAHPARDSYGMFRQKIGFRVVRRIAPSCDESFIGSSKGTSGWPG
jgi:hypothetical protein